MTALLKEHCLQDWLDAHSKMKESAHAMLEFQAPSGDTRARMAMLSDIQFEVVDREMRAPRAGVTRLVAESPPSPPASPPSDSVSQVTDAITRSTPASSKSTNITLAASLSLHATQSNVPVAR